MRNLTFTLLLALCVFVSETYSQDCGKKTKGIITESSTSQQMSVEDVKSIKGKVFLPDGTIAENIIIELFRSSLTVSERQDYKKVGEIFKENRIAARYAGIIGKFCFKNIKAGNYVLRMNWQQSEGNKFSHLSTIYLFVTVNPKAKNQDLELTFDLAI